MCLLLYTIIAIQVLIVLSLLQHLNKIIRKDHLSKVVYQFIPHISEIVGSTKKHNVSGNWTSTKTGMTLSISTIDNNNNVNISVLKTGNNVQTEQLTGTIDNYNGVIYIDQQVDLGDPYYGNDNTKQPVIMLIIDPYLENKLIDPIAGTLYESDTTCAEKVIPHLSGTYKDIFSEDIMDITVTDYIISGKLANNNMLGFINPNSMYFVIFMKGVYIPGYVKNNKYFIIMDETIYEYEKVLKYNN
jgi:hypothetical protein